MILIFRVTIIGIITTILCILNMNFTTYINFICTILIVHTLKDIPIHCCYIYIFLYLRISLTCLIFWLLICCIVNFFIHIFVIVLIHISVIIICRIIFNSIRILSQTSCVILLTSLASSLGGFLLLYIVEESPLIFLTCYKTRNMSIFPLSR